MAIINIINIIKYLIITFVYILRIMDINMNLWQ